MADASENSTENVEKLAVDESEIATNWDEITTTFDAMDLKEDLLRGIYAYGFEKPSAIQQVCNFFVFRKFRFLKFSSSTSARHQTNIVGQRRHCPGSVR